MEPTAKYRNSRDVQHVPLRKIRQNVEDHQSSIILYLQHFTVSPGEYYRLQAQDRYAVHAGLQRRGWGL